ncbi:hypothetical protein F3Y22_tig00117000pilonHSYRG00112 [Hibiscus syriacus]|uniref:Uncharacterized protein n=1 Tax=Hibiscus syriacus TaxID=106335 RepID=A0A6A2WDM4_HIBSY|nr:hypothetical protein F3Y22_tig00117000pilonHSYRG00112 [Hibiscus syriacus]
MLATAMSLLWYQKAVEKGPLYAAIVMSKNWAGLTSVWSVATRCIQGALELCLRKAQLKTGDTRLSWRSS